MKEQEEILSNVLYEWQDDLHQTDDVSVLGIKWNNH